MQKSLPQTENVTPTVLAAAIPCSIATIYLWERKGKLPPRHTTPNGFRVWHRAELEPLLDGLRNFSPLAMRSRAIWAKHSAEQTAA